MIVIKRDKQKTQGDLINAIDKLNSLLFNQNEEEAIAELNDAVEALQAHPLGSDEHRNAILRIIEAFEGDHELIAYTHQREGTQWTEAEELSQASSRVLSLARRMK